jgi:cytochrome P450
MAEGNTIPLANGEGWLSSLRMTRDYLRDPLDVMRRVYRRHGPVARLNLFGTQAVVLLGPEANEWLLRNPGDMFSSELGWHPLIGRTFPRGLISIDGARHRADRRMIGAAFKPAPMAHYVMAMGEGIARELSGWPERLLFYPAAKRLTLGLAAQTLLGLPLGAEADRVSRDFVAMLGASTALVRRPVPGGALWRGMRARERLGAFLREQIPLRRQAPSADIFSAICNTIDDSGSPLSDQAIVDHMALLLMAAHDTTASALTSIVYQLGRHPQWQARVRDELGAWRREHGDRLDQGGLGRLTTTDMVLEETLRCMPPVPSLPRGLRQDVEFGGYRIPAGSAVGIHILHTHYMESLWPEPDRFDPLRFGAEQVRQRHKYAWLPFGGGAHMCVGLHFASMQVKLFLFELLHHRRIELDEGYDLRMQWLPIARPVDNLPITLTPL